MLFKARFILGSLEVHLTHFVVEYFVGKKTRTCLCPAVVKIT